MVSDRQTKVTSLDAPSYIEDRHLLEKVKKKRRRGLARRLVVFFVFIGVAATAMTSMITSQQQTIHEKQQQKASHQEKLVHLQKQENNLTGKVKKLNDPDYIGQMARRDYFMSKNGEVVFKSSGKDSGAKP